MRSVNSPSVLTGKAISRRAVLRGVGTAIALPMLDAMIPARAVARTSANSPVRMAFIFAPNGAYMPAWTPENAGVRYELSELLKPLQPVKDDLIVFTNLAHHNARQNDDPTAGAHSRGVGTFLTGAQSLLDEGEAKIRLGVSVDQFAAQRIGQLTRHASMQIGISEGKSTGCDGPYSCHYSNSISWKDEITPVPKEINPRRVFETLFANELQHEAAQRAAKQSTQQKSLLDFILADAKRLRGQVGKRDQLKLDEYLNSIRDVEVQIEQLETGSAEHLGLIAGYDVPEEIPESYEEHLQIMSDLMVLAFQADLTRVATFMFENAQSSRSYPFIGVKGSHHGYSHYQEDLDKIENYKRVTTYHMQQFSRLLQKLKSIPEGDATLLDNCMVMFGSEIGDGDRHSHDNLPILLGGRGGGAIASRRHIELDRETPVCNLYLSMLRYAGVDAIEFGDSTGELTELEG